MTVMILQICILYSGKIWWDFNLAVWQFSEKSAKLNSRQYFILVVWFLHFTRAARPTLLRIAYVSVFDLSPYGPA